MALSGKVVTSKYDGRYYVLEWSAEQAIEKNKSKISWKLRASGKAGNWYAERTLLVVLAGKTLVNKTSRVERYDGYFKDGYFWVDHKSDGSLSIKGSVQAAVYYSSVNCKGSESFTLDKIPRQANITTAPDFNDEQNPTIHYSNPAGNEAHSLQACISLEGKKADIAYRNISKSEGSYTFSLTEDERNVLRNATTGSNRRTVKFYVKTVIGDHTFYSSLTKNFTIINGTPTVSASVEDTNEKTLALTGNDQTFIRFHSNALVDMTAQARKGASLTEKKIVCGSETINKESGTFLNVENGLFSFRVTDNRNNIETVELNREMIPYVKLSCNLYMGIVSTDGKVDFRITGSCFNGSFGNESNALKVYYRYRTEDSEYGEWVEVPFTSSGETYEAEVSLDKLDYMKQYTFQAMVEDALEEVASKEENARSEPIFDWGERDFNFNCEVQIKKMPLIDVIYPVGSIFTNVRDVSFANLMGGIWEKLPNSAFENMHSWKRLLHEVYVEDNHLYINSEVVTVDGNQLVIQNEAIQVTGYSLDLK